MMKWEARLVDSIKRNILWWAAGAAALLGIFIRYSFLPLLVADMEFFFTIWHDTARDGGLAAAAIESSWSALYLYLLTLVSKLGLESITAVKLIPLAFELLLVAGACLLVYQVSPAGKKQLYTTIAFVLLCVHPVLLLNGAGWGQADICYAAFSVLAVWMLLRGKSIGAMVCLGLSLALKLQAVFILPLFVIYYFCEKNFSIWQFLIVPAVWVLSGVPMALVGQSPLYAITCYIGQAETYNIPTFNCPNLFALLGDALSGKQLIQGMLSRYGMVLAICALGGMAAWLIAKKVHLADRAVLLLGAWCVLVCIFFMPRMHERYGFVGEVLLLCWAACLGKPRGFAYTLLGILPTVSAYCKYMFRNPIFSLQIGAALNLVLLGLLTWELLRETDSIAYARAQASPSETIS